MKLFISFPAFHFYARLSRTLRIFLTLSLSLFLLVSQSPSAVLADEASPPGQNNIHFERISLEDGLSQSSVMSIMQDEQGFLWFATEDGLNRFDGLKFKVFRPVEGDDSSLSDVYVRSLALDAEGSLWAGTHQGGANRYDSATGQFARYQHDENVPDSLSNNYVRAIHLDEQGRLWFGTNAGLDLFNPQTGGFEHFAPPKIKDFTVQAIAHDANGTLWVGTLYGLWSLDPKQKTVSFQTISDKPFPIHKILVDSDDTLWLATAEGLIHFVPKTGKIRQYLLRDGLTNESVRSLWRDRSGRIWAGTANGLNLFDPATETFTVYFNDPNIATSLSGNFIHDLYQDRSGILWIGTYGNGISMFDPLTNKFVHYFNEPKDPQSLGYNMVFAIAPAPDGTVWVGTLGGGLDHFDPRTNTFTHFRHDENDPNSLRNDYVESLCLARDGLLWIGTDAGLDRLDPSTGIFTHFPADMNDSTVLPGATIYTIHQDANGTIWVGSHSGVALYNPTTQTFSRYAETGEAAGLNSGPVDSIHTDRNGILWAGTFSNGLRRLDPQTGAFKNYHHDAQTPGSISNDSILSIYQSQRGDLWIGTAGGGLNRYEPATDSFTVYNDTDGLPNNVIYGILEDGTGALWLSTNFGIARFNPQTGESRNYTTVDGLQSNEFNSGAYARDANGRMYFGGVNGLNSFDPSSMTDNRFVPPISLVSVTRNGTPLQVGNDAEASQTISLKYPENSFEFESAALSFSQSNKNQYAYMLEGFDSDWYYAGTTRTGRYANLPGGDYTLRVKAANSDGVWNETGITIKVTVIPPFWQTWWFYGIVAGVLLSGVFGIYRLRVRGIEMQKKELERQVGERTKEIKRLFEQTKELAIIEERNRLARDLHDSAKQKAFAALAELGAVRSLANSNNGKSAKHLQEAETLVGEVIQEITFLIQEIHPAALKEKGLAPVLREYVFEWSNRTGIHVDLKIEGERRLPLEIEQALYRSIQESLANVARHSAADAVTITVGIPLASVNVSITDNGCGFDSNQPPNGMGLRSIRERMERVGGRFNIDSVRGTGTRLVLQIPFLEKERIEQS